MHESLTVDSANTVCFLDFVSSLISLLLSV